METKEPVILVLTPTWTEIIPVLKVLLESGSDTAKATAWTEIERMAIAADSFNRFARAQAEPVVSRESML